MTELERMYEEIAGADKDGLYFETLRQDKLEKAAFRPMPENTPKGKKLLALIDKCVQDAFGYDLLARFLETAKDKDTTTSTAKGSQFGAFLQVSTKNKPKDPLHIEEIVRAIRGRKRYDSDPLDELKINAYLLEYEFCPYIRKTKEGRALDALLDLSDIFEDEHRICYLDDPAFIEYTRYIIALTRLITLCELREPQKLDPRISLTRRAATGTGRGKKRGLLELAQVVSNTTDKGGALEKRINKAAHITRGADNQPEISPAQLEPLIVWRDILQCEREKREAGIIGCYESLWRYYWKWDNDRPLIPQIEAFFEDITPRLQKWYETIKDRANGLVKEFSWNSPARIQTTEITEHVFNWCKAIFAPAFNYMTAQGRAVPPEEDANFILELYDTYIWILNTPEVLAVISPDTEAGAVLNDASQLHQGEKDGDLFRAMLETGPDLDLYDVDF